MNPICPNCKKLFVPDGCASIFAKHKMKRIDFPRYICNTCKYLYFGEERQLRKKLLIEGINEDLRKQWAKKKTDTVVEEYLDQLYELIVPAHYTLIKTVKKTSFEKQCRPLFDDIFKNGPKTGYFPYKEQLGWPAFFALLTEHKEFLRGVLVCRNLKTGKFFPIYHYRDQDKDETKLCPDWKIDEWFAYIEIK